MQNQDGAIGTMRKDFSDEFTTARTKSQKLILTNNNNNNCKGEGNCRNNENCKKNSGEETLSRKDMEVLERLLAKKIRIEEEEEDTEA